MKLFTGTRWEMSLRAMQAEFLAMALFVFIGCGTAVFFSAPRGFDFNQQQAAVNAVTGSFGVTTALAFGLAITFLVLTFGHISGGHVNCTVTWALFLTKQLSVGQLIGNTISQFAGSLVGAGLLMATVPGNSVASKLGANSVAPGAQQYNALIGEIIMTFVLCITVLMTTSREARSNVGAMPALAIGLSVFAAHAVLIPLDGCSINPTRSFGPAVLSGVWSDFWVFLVGPYVGSSLAALAYYSFQYDVKQEETHNDRVVRFEKSMEKRGSDNSDQTLDAGYEFPESKV